MKIFELLILVFPEENDLFAVIWLKINTSSVFTLLIETLLKLFETNKEIKKKNHSFQHWLYRGIQLIPVIQCHPSEREMRHLVRFLHIFQQGNVRQNTPMNLQLIRVRSVTHQSAQVTKYSFQCTNSNGWGQSLVNQKNRQCLPPLRGGSVSHLTPSHSHPATPLVCSNNSGIGFFLLKVQLFLWEPEWSVQSFQNCRGYIFWRTLAFDQTLWTNQKKFLVV